MTKASRSYKGHEMLNVENVVTASPPDFSTRSRGSNVPP